MSSICSLAYIQPVIQLLPHVLQTIHQAVEKCNFLARPNIHYCLLLPLQRKITYHFNACEFTPHIHLTGMPLMFQILGWTRTPNLTVMPTYNPWYIECCFIW